MTQPLCPVKNEWHEHKKPFHDVYKIKTYFTEWRTCLDAQNCTLVGFLSPKQQASPREKKKKKKNIVEHNLSFAVK